MYITSFVLAKLFKMPGRREMRQKVEVETDVKYSHHFTASYDKPDFAANCVIFIVLFSTIGAYLASCLRL
jgi:hypothetical protein